jgi:hypothetical protein
VVFAQTQDEAPDNARVHDDSLTVSFGLGHVKTCKHPVTLSITHIFSRCEFGAEFDICKVLRGRAR